MASKSRGPRRVRPRARATARSRGRRGGPAERPRRGGQARRRPRAGEGHRAVRRGAGAERRGHGDGRRGRPAARERPPHRQHEDRVAGVGVAARRSACSRSRSGCWSTASSGCRCCRASIVLWSIASLLSAFAGSYGTLLLTRPRARRGGRHGRPRDRLAHGRLLPGARARPDLRLHPRRRDRRNGRRLHRLEQRGKPDRLAGSVRAAGHPGLLPRPRAVADRPGTCCGVARVAWSRGSSICMRRPRTLPPTRNGSGSSRAPALLRPRTTWPAGRPRSEASSPIPSWC